MNPHYKDFAVVVKNPLKFAFFKLSSLPSSFFAGLKVVSFDEEHCTVSVKYSWFNKNPFRSIYFAVLGMAAEMSTGALCMANLYKRKPSASMLVVKIEGEYYKKATGRIFFTCKQGKDIAALIEKCYATNEANAICCETTGVNENGEEVARFWITWSFKVKNS
jgi:hypothetical protein